MIAPAVIVRRSKNPQLFQPVELEAFQLKARPVLVKADAVGDAGRIHAVIIELVRQKLQSIHNVAAQFSAPDNLSKVYHKFSLYHSIAASIPLAKLHSGSYPSSLFAFEISALLCLMSPARSGPKFGSTSSPSVFVSP